CSVAVSSGQTILLAAAPGVDGYAVISGLQIAPATATGSAPTITTQPQSQTASIGADVSFTVAATGTFPLNYQWGHAGTNLPGATASSLNLSNVQTTDAGTYSVVVSNPYGSATSSDATLTLQSANTFTMIDVNFGAHLSPGLNATKSGFAATGASSGDYWNFYSRDDGHGNFIVNGALPDLRFVDSSISAAGLTVSNAPGAWANGSSDPMLNTYLYPFDTNKL